MLTMKWTLMFAFLAGLLTVSYCTEGSYVEGEGEGGDNFGDDDRELFDAVRNLRDAGESPQRMKRACSWWFQWKITGAQADSDSVTKQLDELFRKICNKFGR